MPRFSIPNRYFIVVVCLALAAIGVGMARDHWRPDFVCDSDCIHRSRRLPAGLWEEETQCS
jgi:hypothetical protein